MTSPRCAQQADIVVASCHWGLHKEVLAYMREIGHAAIDAGADLVIGHGPHYSLPVEMYRGKAIFTVWAASRSTPDMVDAGMATGSA